MPLLPFSDASPPTTNASLLTRGTLADARLSTNVVTLTGTQTLTNKSISSGQITGLSAVATSGSAADLTTGTLPLARLNSLVALDNQDNAFSVGQSINSGTLTTSAPALSLTQTWNASGSTFSAMTVNVTDTASASASLMLDCRVGGVSRLRIDKAGNIIANTGGAGGTSGLCMFDTNSKFYAGAGQIIVLSNGSLCGAFASSFYYAQSTGGLGISNDVLLYRDSAGTLAQRNGTNAQTLRIYGTYTDASNGRYFQIGSTTAGIFTLTATGNGTGASGNLLKLTAPILLPSSSVTLATNGDLAFEATSNTSLTIRYRGSDGTTRSAIIALI